MKKILIFLIPIMGISLSLGGTSLAASYSDVGKNHRFQSSIDFWSKEEVLKGYSDGNFHPDKIVSRSEAAIILGRALKIELNGGSDFTDISSSITNRYVEAGRKAGYINGYSATSFKPNEPVSRSQMAIMLSKALKLDSNSPNDINFSDVTSNVTGYKEIKAIANYNITVGFPDGTFRPENGIKRGELAELLTNSFYPYVK